MPSTNQKVTIWALGRLGQRVGSGECFDLADQALRNAGANSAADLGPTGDDADYVWGDSIQLKDAMGGDILQFRDHEGTTTVVTESTFADGTVEDDTEVMTVDREHHTAIVDANLGGGRYRIIEQNVDPVGKKVQRNLLDTRDRSPPPTTSRKFVMNPTTGKVEMATVVVTTTVEVTGTIRAYHPQPK
jgi:hypothetical protein